MTTAAMNGDDERPVTRGELKAELERFATKEEMRSEIAGAMAYVVDTLGARMDQMRGELAGDMQKMRDELSRELAARMQKMHDDLSRELARHVTASAEQTQRLIVGLDDRYRDLPGRVTVLERELDEHRRDSAMHPPRRRR